MKHPLIITSTGKPWNGQRPRIRRSLPYQAIARRTRNCPITYDRDIDVSAMIIKIK